MPRFYPDGLLAELANKYRDNARGLDELKVRCIADTSADTDRVREFMQHGVARRLGVLRQTLINVFSEFPPETEVKLDRDSLMSVQINLQAFVINLVGIFDNMAWGFVLLHEAKEEVGGRHGVGMFKDATKRILPPELRDYLNLESSARWHGEYLKNYRDSLAHRIPLYIPPSSITDDEGRRLGEIQPERFDAIMRRDYEAVDALIREQEAIGAPCFVFLQSLSEDEGSKPVYLHPQMLCDAATVLEFGNLFLTHWRTRSSAP